MTRARRSSRPRKRASDAHPDSTLNANCRPARNHCEPSSTCKAKNTCRDSAQDATDLRLRYRSILDRNEAPDWHEIWHLLVTHPWFVGQLNQCGRTALRGAQLPGQLAEDVVQAVILNLANKLKRTPNLHIDHDRAETQFVGWMRTILLRECRMEIRRLRRLHFRMLPLLIDKPGADPHELLDASMDLDDALSQLDDDDSAVLLLSVQGCAANEIADLLDVSLSTAYRLIRRANARLKRKLR